MTKKDYKNIAECIAKYIDSNSLTAYNIHSLIDIFCDMLEDDNIRFNSVKFIKYIDSLTGEHQYKAGIEHKDCNKQYAIDFTTGNIGLET